MSKLSYNTLFGSVNHVEIAIDRLKAYEPEEGYYLAYSGGKDSVVILDLAKRAWVKFEAHNAYTTIDPPELVYFVRNTPGIIIDKPEKSFFDLVVEQGTPPTRISRYCCRLLKEGGGENRTVVTGVRHGESVKRSKRQMYEICNKENSNKHYLHPIIDWSSEQVWEYIRGNNLPYCKLYDEGFKRLGCLICPQAGKSQRIRDATRYPRYKQAYILCFDRMIKRRIENGKECSWENGKAVWDWWINDLGNNDKETECFIFD